MTRTFLCCFPPPPPPPIEKTPAPLPRILPPERMTLMRLDGGISEDDGLHVSGLRGSAVYLTEGNTSGHPSTGRRVVTLSQLKLVRRIDRTAEDRPIGGITAQKRIRE